MGQFTQTLCNTVPSKVILFLGQMPPRDTKSKWWGVNTLFSHHCNSYSRYFSRRILLNKLLLPLIKVILFLCIRNIVTFNKLMASSHLITKAEAGGYSQPICLCSWGPKGVFRSVRLINIPERPGWPAGSEQ